MAQRQYDIIRGTGLTGVVESAGAAIGASGVRITIDDGNAGTKIEALDLIQTIQNIIAASENWPPS
jgi:hypothetical protein